MMHKTPKAIVFNKHGVGHMARVEHFPKPGETLRALEWKFGEDAGKGTNVAMVLGLLGIETAFICKVGRDHEGELGVQWLQSVGVDVTHFQLDAALQTDVGLVITQTDGENVIIGSPVHACYSTFADVRQAIDDFEGAAYFLTGFEIDQELPLEACRYAKSKGMQTLLNPSPLVKIPEQTLEYVDYLFVNEIEAAQLAGMQVLGENWQAAMEQILARYKPKHVLMTLGATGCAVGSAGRISFCPSYRVNVVDTIGAGDGFMAAFTAGLSWGMDSVEAADWANRYSAVVVSRKGSILSYPTLEQVRELSRGLQKNLTKEGA